MKGRFSARAVLLAGVCFVLVILLVRGVELGLGFWQRQTETLANARQRFARLEGWLEVQEKVVTRHREVLGPLATASGANLSWVTLQGLQQAAQAQGLSVRELRPSQLPAQGQRPPMLRLDLRVEGSLQQMVAFLQQIPDKVPGARLENLQFLPQEAGQAQGLVRLNIPVREPSSSS